MDDLLAVDGGSEAKKWQKRHAKRKLEKDRTRKRRAAQEARERRWDNESRRKKRVAKIERDERHEFRKRRKAEGYTRVDLPFKDLTGKRYGLLLVIRPGGHIKSGSKLWWVQCDCRSPLKEVRGTNLQQGFLRSCGCCGRDGLRAEWHSPKFYKRRVAREAAKRKELAKPISYQLLRLRRKFKEGSAEAKLISRARNLIVWAELQKGIIKPKKCWKTDRYRWPR